MASEQHNLDECWCCGGLHDSFKALCPACDDAGCKHFGGDCQSDHKPVMPDGGRAQDDSGTPQSLAMRIYEFNQQFDYGEYHDDPAFWIEMLAHQADEAREALNEGDEPHAYREAADAVLVAFQFMRSCGDAPPQHYVLERIENAEERGIDDEIIPKYLDWYRSNHAE